MKLNKETLNSILFYIFVYVVLLIIAHVMVVHFLTNYH